MIKYARKGLIITVLLAIIHLSNSLSFPEPVYKQNAKDKYYKKSRFNVRRIIKKYGYPLEVHRVVTDDGYVLEMHRIPGPRRSPYPRNVTALPGAGRSVYIQHCIFCSSSHFVLNEPDQALAYLLADAGFDVWLGNYRGNIHSRRHVYLSPDETPFWLFSFMEMGKYDVPAMIKHILKKTKRKKISYIGHSMGTTGLFSALALYPELNNKVDVMIAMAPVIYMDHTRGPFRGLLDFAKVTFKFWEDCGKAEFGALSQIQEDLSMIFCQKGNIFVPFCEALVTSVGGFNKGYIDDKHLPAILSNIPAGTSIRAVAHLGQLAGPGGFVMFDMGPKYNLKHYGSVHPPEFNLGNVHIPVALFWSENDAVSHPKDVELVAQTLPNVVFNYRVPQEDFNHMDFLFSDTAREMVYEPIINFLLYYS